MNKTKRSWEITILTQNSLQMNGVVLINHPKWRHCSKATNSAIQELEFHGNLHWSALPSKRFFSNTRLRWLLFEQQQEIIYWTRRTWTRLPCNLEFDLYGLMHIQWDTILSKWVARELIHPNLYDVFLSFWGREAGACSVRNGSMDPANLPFHRVQTSSPS